MHWRDEGYCTWYLKEFYKDRHARLLYKLKAYCWTNPKYLFLQERSLKVVLDGQSSHLYITNNGVPLGSVLGQSLFLVYINDLPNEVLSRIGIYADDITLFQS